MRREIFQLFIARNLVFQHTSTLSHNKTQILQHTIFYANIYHELKSSCETITLNDGTKIK